MMLYPMCFEYNRFVAYCKSIIFHFSGSFVLSTCYVERFHCTYSAPEQESIKSNLNISKYVCKKSGGLTTNFVDSRIFKLKNWILCSLALEHCMCIKVCTVYYCVFEKYTNSVYMCTCLIASSSPYCSCRFSVSNSYSPHTPMIKAS